MIKGVGTDLVSVERLRALHKRFGEALAAKILHSDEKALYGQKIDQAAFLAKRWAAKEALLKALGTGMRAGMAWRQMWVTHDVHGAPLMHVSGTVAVRLKAIGATTIHLSLADERDYALAFVVLT